MAPRAVLTAAALGFATTAAWPGGAAAATPVVGCAAHAEPNIPGFQAERDVVRGPFALVTARARLGQLSRASYRPHHGRLAGAKLPVGLRAGRRATLRVAPAQRDHVGLVFRPATHAARRVRDADAAVTFAACAADTPAFSGGTVGPVTGWPGAVIVTGPRCVRFELRVDGRRLPDILLPLGRRC